MQMLNQSSSYRCWFESQLCCSRLLSLQPLKSVLVSLQLLQLSGFNRFPSVSCQTVVPGPGTFHSPQTTAERISGSWTGSRSSLETSLPECPAKFDATVRKHAASAAVRVWLFTICAAGLFRISAEIYARMSGNPVISVAQYCGIKKIRPLI